jgi:hypothetical protein
MQATIKISHNVLLLCAHARFNCFAARRPIWDEFM